MSPKYSTRCQIFHVKCTKFNFSLTALPRGEFGGEEERKEGKEGEERGKEGKGRRREREERVGKGRKGSGKDDSWFSGDRRPLYTT